MDVTWVEVHFLGYFWEVFKLLNTKIGGKKAKIISYTIPDGYTESEPTQ